MLLIATASLKLFGGSSTFVGTWLAVLYSPLFHTLVIEIEFFLGLWLIVDWHFRPAHYVALALFSFFTIVSGGLFLSPAIADVAVAVPDGVWTIPQTTLGTNRKDLRRYAIDRDGIPKVVWRIVHIRR